MYQLKYSLIITPISQVTLMSSEVASNDLGYVMIRGVSNAGEPGAVGNGVDSDVVSNEVYHDVSDSVSFSVIKGDERSISFGVDNRVEFGVSDGTSHDDCSDGGNGDVLSSDNRGSTGYYD